MSLLGKLKTVKNEIRAVIHPNWLQKMAMRDPKTASQVTEVMEEYIKSGCVGDFRNKHDIYEWLIREGIDLQCTYSSFSRVIKEHKAGQETHGSTEEEEKNAQVKTGNRRKS
jgi:HSP90 family molecular chaperone